jgi:hypothetical protein
LVKVKKCGKMILWRYPIEKWRVATSRQNIPIIFKGIAKEFGVDSSQEALNGG